jgi:CO dehydrogenase/acetyl-CoA synthase gamma subunit (corrinoid Fe-S protein)
MRRPSSRPPPQPPIRLITLTADGRQVKAGNETVLFRHEKTFYNPQACSCA